MPAHKANELRDRLTGYELSLDAEMAPVQKRTDLEIGIWYEALKALGNTGYRTLSTVSEIAERPDERAARAKQPSEEELDRRAASVSTPGAKR